MVKKLQKLSPDKNKTGTLLSGAVKDSAQQIWLAGLGAFSRAQEEGSKVFESLVKEGMAVQRKTQTAAEEKMTEATSRMTSMASDIGARAAGKWDKLESIFEDRVAKAMATLGVPSAHDLQALTDRLDALEKSLNLVPATDYTRAKPAAKTQVSAAPPPATKAGARKTAVPATVRTAVKAAPKKRATKAERQANTGLTPEASGTSAV
ncbi:phasin family protein [Simplicispira psychrophila]|uniref:phasin family protein n=1 Tax=Simplicispira psychrophila TaxID=80882 RepID=UPI000485E68A|nr:phasin family protein [Simplicispira psychrophila]